MKDFSTFVLIFTAVIGIIVGVGILIWGSLQSGDPLLVLGAGAVVLVLVIVANKR